MTQPACATNRSATLDSGERLHEWFGENGHYIEAEEQPDGSLEWMLVMPGWKPFHFFTKAREACPTTPAETSGAQLADTDRTASSDAESQTRIGATRDITTGRPRASASTPSDPIAAWREARGPSRGEVYSFEALARAGDLLFAEAERLRDLNARMGEGRTGWPVVHQMQRERDALRKEIESERATMARLIETMEGCVELHDSCSDGGTRYQYVIKHRLELAIKEYDNRRRAAREGGADG